jgi:hypothetical protein
MKYFLVKIEVWRRAYFKKARPKLEEVTFKADDTAQLLRFVQEHAAKFYGRKQWKVVDFHEITHAEVIAK